MQLKSGKNSLEIIESWKKYLIGQNHVIDSVTPYITRAFAGLNDPEKPIGIFLLMGPSGVGKTKTAETLAQVLHGSEKLIIRIDCAEFQMEHEVAKLIGAPPGYVGHRETQPILTQQKLNSCTSENCKISILLFDEIEKAHPTVHRLLLGIMDKGMATLGDSLKVLFNNTVIFMSSNLAGKEINDLFMHSFGFSLPDVKVIENLPEIEKLGQGKLSRKFSPEFVNRIDEIFTYHPLTIDNLLDITRLELNKIQDSINRILLKESFILNFDPTAIQFIIENGTDNKWGARELKRVINRHILNPISNEIIEGKVAPGSSVYFYVKDRKLTWVINPPLDILGEPSNCKMIEPEIESKIPDEKPKRISLIPWKAPKSF
jgi:ATP-dependent Clp protease ATP-binding subunit ClpA